MASIQIGQPSYGLLDTNIPAQAALAPIKGAGAVNALQQQVLQNEASQFEMQNALAEQEAYKRAAQGQGSVSQNLLGAGLGGKAAAYAKTTAEAQKLGLEGQLKQAELHRDRLNVLAGDPSDTALVKYYQNGVASGEFTPEQAEQSWAQMRGKTPDQRRRELLPQAMKMDQYTKYLADQEQLKISQQNANIAGGHLALARERLSQEMAGGQLTPETVDMVANIFLKTGTIPSLGMGKQAAAARQQILNRATQLGTTATDGQPAPAPADVANQVKDAKQLIAGERSFINKEARSVRAQNVLVDHLETLGSAADALKNNDIRGFNALGNKLAKETGQAAPTDFDGVKKIVGDELVKAIQGGAGGVFDRKEIQETLSSANSPAQLASMVNRYKQLAKGQLQGLEKQYESQSGKKDFRERFLTEGAKKEIGGAAPVTIKSDAEYNALKSGTVFIGPDGQQRRKP